MHCTALEALRIVLSVFLTLPGELCTNREVLHDSVVIYKAWSPTQGSYTGSKVHLV